MEVAWLLSVTRPFLPCSLTVSPAHIAACLGTYGIVHADNTQIAVLG